MRHVDEGALHAWLDGELDALPPGEAAWIREHLESCGACALRLEEERRVRDAAEGILAAAPVDLSGLPSLEEMRARARRQAGSGAEAGGTRARARQMAWAASIVLAAGAGWMANALFPRIQGDRDPAVQFLRPDPATLVAPAGDEAVRGDQDAAGEGSAAGAAEATAPEAAGAQAARSAPAATAAEQDASPHPAPAGRGVSTEERAVEEKVAAPDPGAEARSRESALQAALESARVVAAPLPDSLATGISPTADAAGARPAVLLRRSLADAEASRAALAVPELPVISTTFLVPGDPSGGVVLRQRLPEGDTLEVYHLPSHRGPDLLPALEAGVRQWVAPREAGWLVLRGRTTEAELQALGERLLGG
ncbi:MAG TPA: zf-HC2 domain-containing protein [Longimicrobiales bacterium]|nr:zf-HC2 domain-containing protein [Longimicrobiales bacterium]